MTHPYHRHIPFPLDAITGITVDRCARAPAGLKQGRRRRLSRHALSGSAPTVQSAVSGWRGGAARVSGRCGTILMTVAAA